MPHRKCNPRLSLPARRPRVEAPEDRLAPGSVLATLAMPFGPPY
jgi:hypothetical protein